MKVKLKVDRFDLLLMQTALKLVQRGTEMLRQVVRHVQEENQLKMLCESCG